jgi:hypothetical protein
MGIMHAPRMHGAEEKPRNLAVLGPPRTQAQLHQIQTGMKRRMPCLEL